MKLVTQKEKESERVCEREKERETASTPTAVNFTTNIFSVN